MVVAIIALLVSILVPALNKAKAVALQAVCASNLHQLHVGTMTFANANDGELLRGTGDWHYDDGMIFLWRSTSEQPPAVDYFGQTPDLWYCPANPIRPDTSWPWPGLGPLESYDRAWASPQVHPLKYFTNVTFMRLFHFAQVMNDFDYEAETVTNVNASATLGLWADCNIWMPQPKRWLVGNHPGINFDAGEAPEGRNLCRLGGDVTWEAMTEEMNERVRISDSGGGYWAAY